MITSRIMNILSSLCSLGLIYTFVPKSGDAWFWNGMSIFDEMDLDRDGIITKHERYTNPNEAILKAWVLREEKIPADVLNGGITRREFYDHLRNGGRILSMGTIL